MTSLTESIAQFFERRGIPVVFCGAGIAVQAGLPSWSHYLTALADRIACYDELTAQQMRQAVDKKLFTDAAEYFYMSRAISDGDRMDMLVEPFHNPDYRAIAPLFCIPVRAYVTTNFDRSLLDMYALHHQRAPFEAHLGDTTLKAAMFRDDLYIARIHGRIDVPESLILRQRDFEQLHNNSEYIQFLVTLLTRRNVLFVGFSFLDPAIRSVLEIVRTHYGVSHKGRHAALLPSDANHEFIAELGRFSIETIYYDPHSSHRELWSALETFCSTDSATREDTEFVDIRSHPFDVARRYLATCFARLRLNQHVAPLWRLVVEGMVAALVQTSDSVDIVFLKEQISRDLSISASLSNDLVSAAVHSLTNEGLCRYVNKANSAISWTGDSKTHYGDALSVLAGGIADRYVVREGLQEPDELRPSVESFLHELVLQRGWDLGAAYAAHDFPPDIDVERLVDEFDETTQWPPSTDRSALTRAARDLLTRPDTHEGELLARLGRTSFAIELVTQAPHETVFHARTLPEQIFLDSNVLMPTILEGHPHHDVYQHALAALADAAATYGWSIPFRVSYGFLNEIVSHRSIALQKVQEYGDREWEFLRRDVEFYGTENINVFLGAYATLRSHGHISRFSEFLRTYAPYETESELAKHLSQLGYTVTPVKELLKQGSQYDQISLLLQKAYAGRLQHKQKSMYQIQHDAEQLAGLNVDSQSGRRSIFVTADRSLRTAVDSSAFSFLGNMMVSHSGFTQLVDLLVQPLGDSRASASLLWTGVVSDEAERIRDYLVDRALREYDVGMAKTVHQIVDDIAEDIEGELNREDLSFDSTDDNVRTKAMRILESFEDRFFENMRAALDASKREE